MNDYERLKDEVENWERYNPNWLKLKLLADEGLQWGTKLLVVWKGDADFSREHGGDPFDYADKGFLIGLPGMDNDPYCTGVVWCPSTRGEKCDAGPEWILLGRLLEFEDLEAVWVLGEKKDGTL